MAIARDKKARDLSVHLLKEEVQLEDAVREPKALKSLSVRIGSQDATLFIRRGVPQFPTWASLFSEQIEPSEIGRGQSISGVLPLKVAGRVVVLSFGASGRSLIADNAAEETFGLRVVLNSADPSKLNSVDKQTLDSFGRQTRVQTSRASSIAEFGIDVERDLLRAVTCRPTDDELGLRMTGADSLRVSVRIDLEDLPKLLRSYIERSQETKYKRHFPWVDQVRGIASRSMAATLDQELCDLLNAGSTEDLVLAVPTIVEWDNISRFEYEGLGDSLTHAELDLTHALSTAAKAKKTWTPERLRAARIHAVDPDDARVYSWTFHRCVHGQVTLSGRSYVLSSSKWYEVKKSFIAEIDDAVASIEPFKPDFMPFEHKDEEEYCKAVPAWQSRWIVMDRKTVVFGGNRSRIEFCDLFDRDAKTLVHVKRYGGSAPLSHLFAQALASGQTFRIEKAFRAKLDEKLPSAGKLGNVEAAPEGYKVVLAIARHGTLRLPFFAKVNLCSANKHLTGYGFYVRLAHIQVTDAYAKIQKEKKKNKGIQ